MDTDPLEKNKENTFETKRLLSAPEYKSHPLILKRKKIIVHIKGTFLYKPQVTTLQHGISTQKDFFFNF